MIKKRYLFLILVLILILTGHLKAAKPEADTKKTEALIKKYEDTVRINPHDAEARQNLANAYYSLNRYNEALREYDEALKLAPELGSLINPLVARIHFIFGNNLLTQGQTEEARQEFEEAQKYAPEMEKEVVPLLVKLYLARAQENEKKELWEEAKKDYQEVLKLDPGQEEKVLPSLAEVEFQLGKKLSEEKKYEEALKELISAFNHEPNLKDKIDPLLISIYLELARNYIQQGQDKEALEKLSAVLKIDPRNSEAQALIAQIKAKSEEGADEETLLDTARRNPKNVAALYRMGNYYWQQNKYPRAESYYAKVLELDREEKYFDLHELLMRYYLGTRQYEKALKEIDKILEKKPRNALLHYQMGAILSHLRQYREAILEYREAVRLDHLLEDKEWEGYYRKFPYYYWLITLFPYLAAGLTGLVVLGWFIFFQRKKRGRLAPSPAVIPAEELVPVTPVPHIAPAAYTPAETAYAPIQPELTWEEKEELRKRNEEKQQRAEDRRKKEEEEKKKLREEQLLMEEEKEKIEEQKALLEQEKQRLEMMKLRLQQRQEYLEEEKRRKSVPQLVLFQFRSAPARQVVVAGSFNQWCTDPQDKHNFVPLVRDVDGHWKAVLSLREGKYQYKFLVDGTNWVLDPKNPDVFTDEKGNLNSVLTVEPK